MKIDNLRERISSFNVNEDDIMNLYDELEASYQQLVAMSEQLTNTENQYSTLLQNMRDIAWIADPDGEIQFINRTVADILGYRPESMVGKRLYEFMCPLHEYKTGSCRDVVALMKDIEFKHVEMWMLHSDGNTRKVLEVNTRQIFMDDVFVQVQGVGRDITDRIQIERRIKQKTLQMKFISDISASINQNLSLNNLDGLINDTCRRMVTVSNVPLCTVRLMNEGGELVLKAANGRLKGQVERTHHAPDDPHLRQVVQDHASLLITMDDVPYASESIKKVFEDNRIKCLLILPLNTNEATVGTMAVGLDMEYDDDFTPLFESVANNLAFAVEKTKLYQNIKAFYMDIIMTLVAAMEAKDPYTQGHSLRVADYSVKIAKQLELTVSDIEEIEIAGVLHDIGKIGISDVILTKPGPLSAEEFEVIKSHTTIGMKILDKISLSENIRQGILYHHLRYDLGGYPKNESLVSQPIFARIIGAADALDAMTSDRAYRRAMGCHEVKSEFARHSGTQFCPKVVEAMMHLLENKEIIPLSECC